MNVGLRFISKELEALNVNVITYFSSVNVRSSIWTVWSHSEHYVLGLEYLKWCAKIIKNKIMKAIQIAKNNKSPCLDQIDGEILKLCEEYYIVPLENCLISFTRLKNYPKTVYSPHLYHYLRKHLQKKWKLQTNKLKTTELSHVLNIFMR